MMKIAFFCRSRLTQLYGELNRHLADDFSCVYVAYEEEDTNLLKKSYSVDADINFKEYIYKEIENAKKIDINEIDHFIIKWSSNRFNLNSVIQSDRALCNLDQQDSYIMIKLYYIFWKEFFDTHKEISVFFHETTSLALNFIASLFCTKNNVIYTDMVGVPNYEPSFMFISSSVGESKDFERKEAPDISVIEKFEEYIAHRYKSIANLSIDTSLSTSIKIVLKNSIKRLLNRFTKKIDRVLDCVEWFMLHDKRYTNKIKNFFLYKTIKWDQIEVTDSYFYYSMNLEPEAVIQYLADGYYSNQVKLIENVAAQLPPNTYLYVKDHVVEYGYRNYKDYKYLQSLHNVKVIDPRIRGSQLIKNCKAVISICGTAILEAHFFNKCSYMFGNFYYEKSKNVIKIQNIKDFRKVVYSEPLFNTADKNEFIDSFLASLHPGSPDYFTGGNIDRLKHEEFSQNIVKISEAIKKYTIKNCDKREVF